MKFFFYCGSTRTKTIENQLFGNKQTTKGIVRIPLKRFKIMDFWSFKKGYFICVLLFWEKDEDPFNVFVMKHEFSFDCLNVTIFLLLFGVLLQFAKGRWTEREWDFFSFLAALPFLCERKRDLLDIKFEEKFDIWHSCLNFRFGKWNWGFLGQFYRILKQF